MLKRINFQSITVDDQERARDFYRDVMDMQVHTDVLLDHGARWIFMAIEGSDTLLQLHKKSDTAIPDLALICDDVDREIEDLKAKGCVVITEPEQAYWNPHVRFAMVNDTEDNTILIQSSAAEEASHG